MAFPIGMLFVHDVIGAPLDVASALVPITAVGSLFGHPLAGYISDRYNAFWGSFIPVLISAIGALLYSTATNLSMALVGAAITGIGLGTSTGWFTLLANLTPPDKRAFAFSSNQVFMNMGIGAGLVVSGLAATLGSADVYRVLFLLKAICHIFLAFLIASVHSKVRKVRIGASKEKWGSTKSAHSRRGNLSLLSVVIFVNITYVAFGIAQLDSAFVAGILSRTDFPVWLLAVSMIMNTLSVIFFNVILSPKLVKFPPHTLLTLTSITWSLSWLICMVGLTVPLRWGIGMFLLSMALFSLGEVLAGIGVPSLTERVSGEGNYGRGFSFQNLATSVAFIGGPSFTTYTLKYSSPTSLFLYLSLLILLLIPILYLYKISLRSKGVIS
ncbi:MFS family permease [Corynebacterium felinum]|uniref:MFS family permease n=2 Tax=Corynebacterium felinum TaxID=131318 RepID=A0ABU2B731_9CORY|nr:MFS family permease [Corynebacterium felinum]